MSESGAINIKKRINARKLMLSYLYQHRFFLNMQNTLEKADASVEEVSFISEEEHLEGAETKVSGANAMGT